MPATFFPKLASQFRKLALGQYGKGDFKVNSKTVNTSKEDSDSDSYGYGTSMTSENLDTGDKASNKEIETSSGAQSSYSDTDASGDIKSIETSGDSFEKTKLFQPKT